ncbi:hypothetical protein ATN83_3876 [Raoultella ornithinolytica]|jgi:hypothetical protein|nr:hypothetical protein ATN83_3876 [Raoultella ornithinolytica]KDV95305.1 hypothetical protein AB00_0887 [Raoultella ornithinolytica 2-156-04_S1_C1]KDX16143.1 hypothetical protein AB28_0895 [Raoultella ornithinolytica 2-156-04_S1_C2]
MPADFLRRRHVAGSEHADSAGSEITTTYLKMIHDASSGTNGKINARHKMDAE